MYGEFSPTLYNTVKVVVWNFVGGRGKSSSLKSITDFNQPSIRSQKCKKKKIKIFALFINNAYTQHYPLYIFIHVASLCRGIVWEEYGSFANKWGEQFVQGGSSTVKICSALPAGSHRRGVACGSVNTVCDVSRAIIV
jgi:hypothetical protein